MFVRDITLATFAPLPSFFAVGVEANKLVAVRKLFKFRKRGVLSALNLCDPESTDRKRSPNASWAGITALRAVPCSGQVDYGNAGAMLLHVEMMRRTHAEFVRFTFSEQQVAAGNGGSGGD